jgi:hypothetical protein
MLERGKRVRAGVDACNLEAALRERVAYRLADRDVVVDDE